MNGDRQGSLALALERGKADAVRDIQNGRLRLYWGTRGGWGKFFHDLLRDRFGVEVESTSCFVDAELDAYEDGYNSTIESHIDERFGDGSFNAACEEVDQFRKNAYDAYFNSGREG